MVHLAKDLKYIDDIKHHELIETCNEISKTLSGLIKTFTDFMDFTDFIDFIDYPDKNHN